MRWKSRSLWLALVALGYVLLAALRAEGGEGLALVALVAVPTALSVLWHRSSPPTRGEDWVLPATRKAMRLAGFGAALLVAAEQAAPGTRFFDGAALLGVALSGVACLLALARIAPSGGLLIVPRSATRLLDAALLGASGLAAFAWIVRPASSPEGAAVTSGAFALATLAAITFASNRIGRLRRVDLGAAERLRATLSLGWVALLVGPAAAFAGLGSPARVLETMACAASMAATATCIARDAAQVARAQRTLVVVAVFAAPAALFAASVAGRAPRDAGIITFLALGLGLEVGLAAGPLERALGGEASRWREGFAAATRASLGSEPTASMTSALTQLREALGPGGAGAELWCNDPPSVFYVDRAGYGQARLDPSLPELALELCETEPEQTLRTAVLETLEVRRADVRPLLAWLHDRDALSLTLLRDPDGPTGALLLPAAGRRAPLTLEEVRDLRILAERLSCLLGAQSQIARAHAREMTARRAADQAEDRALYLAYRLSGTEGHEETGARRLAAAASLAAYSPAARMALDELTRLGALGAPVTLVTPIGVDAVPYAAHVHLNARGPRSRGPFVVSNAVATEERELSAWTDAASSPLCRADGGTLVVLDIGALPADTQAYVAECLAFRRSPSQGATPLDVALVVSVTSPTELLARRDAPLDPALCDRIGEHTVVLPSLAARAEDLRALFIDHLARIGMRLRGQPVGLDAKALALLVEHSWPANELELTDVLTRAVAVSEEDVLTVAHLDAIGFVCRPAPLRRSSRAPRSGEPRTTQVP